MIELQDLVRVRDHVKNNLLPDLETLIATVTARGNGLTPAERRIVAAKADRAATKINNLLEIERIDEINTGNQDKLADIRR